MYRTQKEMLLPWESRASLGGDGDEMTFQTEGKEDKGTKGKGPEIFREQ